MRDVTQIVDEPASAISGGSVPASESPSKSSPAHTFRVRLLYGIGEGAVGITSALSASLIVFYYSEVRGLPPAMVSAALVFGVILVPLADFLIGSISDGISGRLGRRHVFLYGSAIPLLLGTWALFSPPAQLSGSELFAWLFVFSTLAALANTLFYVPHFALGAELSEDYHQRTVITAYRAFFYYAGMASVYLVSKLVFVPTAQFPVGQFNPSYYPMLGLGLGIASALCALLAAIGTHSEIGKLPKPRKAVPLSLKVFVANLIDALKQRSFRLIALANFCFLVAFLLSRGMDVYMGTYFWRLSTQQVFDLLVSAIAGSICAPFIWPALSRIFGKRECWVAAISFYAFVVFTLPVLKNLGIFPPHDSTWYYVLIFGSSAVAGLMGGCAYVLTASMLADVADDFELRTRNRSAGLMFGSISIAIKLGVGGGSILAGLVVAAVGLKGKVSPELVAPWTVQALGYSYAILISGIALIAVYLTHLYPLDLTRFRELRTALEAARARD
jgi:Na+/melibiose symporter-like transporter